MPIRSAVKGIRGATVYTVSDKASDPEAQALADRENLSDQFAGMEIKDDNKEVTDILIDLIRRETHNFSMSFAHTLVGLASLAWCLGPLGERTRTTGRILYSSKPKRTILGTGTPRMGVPVVWPSRGEAHLLPWGPSCL